jgi:uncharacterized protein YacL
MLITVRLLFIMTATVLGFVISTVVSENVQELLQHKYWATAGFCFSSIIVFIEVQTRKAHPKELVIGAVGLLFGLLTAKLLTSAVPIEIFDATTTAVKSWIAASITIYLVLGYIGLVVALRYVDRFDFSRTKLFTNPEGHLSGCKLLDTSVLIDGRILDIAKTYFVDGLFVIPNFVLQELQTIADSADGMKRKRGRRGLDIVKQLQITCGEYLEIVERAVPRGTPVDEALVLVARETGGSILTNDYNLNKVAEIQDVRVLNINDLANSLKQVVLPGEELEVVIVNAGKEPSQGVGYLDDGTMVVVEGGYSSMNRKIGVTVTSVLQTAAGRMIFSRMRNHHETVTH